MPDAIQRAIAALLLILSLPALCVLAVLIRVGSPGPIFYRGSRIGLRGREFQCYKLRTMRQVAGIQAVVTFGDDQRITPLGRRIRRIHLDELPQLWNVLRGDMSLIGPRPEAPELVDTGDARWQLVLAVRPGIAGLAQLVFADEARLLPSRDPEGTYRREIQPRKLAIDSCYVARRSPALDVWIMFRTVTVVLGRPATMDEVRRRVGCSFQA